MIGSTEPPEARATATESDSVAIRKLAYRKADNRMVFWYSFVYLIMRINVGNISNTAIMNAEEGNSIRSTLRLNSHQWAWAVSIFYYPYMFAEPLSTLLLKHYTPSVWMARIMVTWGIISMCQAATQNAAGILAARFFLGLAEAGFFPGVLYHLSFWFPAKNTAIRVAFLFAGGAFSGTISGLLAYAVAYMNGIRGLEGWRWLFILEGIPPVLCGVCTYFLLPNFPETSGFLTEDEKRVILQRLPKSQPSSEAKTWDVTQAIALLHDPTFYTFSLIWVAHSIGASSATTVLPQIIYELGFTGSAESQLLTIPTYSASVVGVMILGWLIQLRKLTPWPTVVFLEILNLACFIALAVVTHPVAKYVVLSTAIASSICIYATVWPERIRVAQGATGTALAIGMTNGLNQLVGIVGPQVYRSQFGPTYRTSYYISVGLVSVALASMLASWLLVRKRDGLATRLLQT